MGKKVKKKARSGQKEKQVSAASPKSVSEQSCPSIDILADKVSVVKERKVCPHLDKGIDLVEVSVRLGSSVPIRCNDCREGMVDRRTSKGKGKHGKKKGSGSVDLNSESKATWVCLGCGQLSCGGVGLPTTPRFHAVRHAKQNHHPLAVQFQNPRFIWCFLCKKLIPVEKLEENGEEKDVLHDILKMIKGRPPEGASVEVEDVQFASGSVRNEIQSENTIPTSLDGRAGYVVRGLVNLGNTCFFNSIMQNLLALDRMRNYFLNFDVSVGPLTADLKQLYIETGLETGLRNVINPKSFFGCLCAMAPQFKGYQQHDSHELLRCLLDGLCTEESNARKQTRTSKEDGISLIAAPTFVDAIFGGQLCNTVSCLHCAHSSIVYEPFLDLSLPVLTKKPPKKAQPVYRTKKPKLPPRRSGRIRSKGTKDANPVPAQSALDQSTDSKSSCQVQPGVTIAEKLVVSSGNATLLESIDPSTVTDDKSSASKNISVTKESENMNVNITEKTGVSLDNSTLLDYLEPGTMSNEHDMASQDNDIKVIQDCGNRDAAQNDALSHHTLEPSREICSKCDEEPALSSGNLTWLDYCGPNKLSDISLLNDKSGIQDSGNEDVGQNDVFLKHNTESGSQVCSMGSNLRVDYLGNSWEDEAPSHVQDSEILLLTNKKDTSTIGEISRAKDEVSSLSVGCEQDSLDLDGFGDLFNKPEAETGPSVKSLPSNNACDANEVAETGFMIGNCSESDPGEIDNTTAPVSIESCLAFFMKPEFLSKNEHAWQCGNCSKALQEQKMRSRKKGQKPKSKISVNRGEDRNSNALLGFVEDSEGSKDEASESMTVKRDATKGILINKAPPILTIHLKRFSQSARGHISKLSGHVDFRDTIDLKPYIDPRCTEKREYKYRLIGVVEHSGNMRSGHYIAYVRGTNSSGNADKEKGDFVWYHTSDSYVRETSLEEVLSSEAYLLFYEEI